jgi:hypothetical protein
MYLLLLLPLAIPFACLALLSSIAFLGVVALGGALHVIGEARSLLRIAAPKDNGPWPGAVGDAHPLDYVEARR